MEAKRLFLSEDHVKLVNYVRKLLTKVKNENDNDEDDEDGYEAGEVKKKATSTEPTIATIKLIYKLIRDIETSYDFTNIPVDAFKGTKPNSPFYQESPMFAGYAYSQILPLATTFSVGQNLDIFKFRYRSFSNDLIEKLKEANEIEVNVDFIYAIWDILFENIILYSAINDFKHMIISYRKAIELIPDFVRSDEKHIDILNKLVKPFSILFSDLADRMELLFGKKMRIYSSNSKLFTAYLDALTYAQDDEPCIVIGETGVGKEIVAQLMHSFSHRRKNNLSIRNCGNFTPSLFDSELQGVHWGAATSIDTRLGGFLSACGRTEVGKDYGYALAPSKTKGKHEIIFNNRIEKQGGKLEIAVQDNPEKLNFDDIKEFTGTVFLDEINSIPLDLQSKLLRIIQEKEVYVVGIDKPYKYSAKVICVTNEDPTNDREGKILRRDLFYRISRGIVAIPTLREMPESIIDIAEHLIESDPSKIHKRRAINLSDDVKDMLTDYRWPGNIRELENVLYRATKRALFEDTDTIETCHFDAFFNKPYKKQKRIKKISDVNYDNALDTFKKQYMKELHDKSKGNKSEAGRIAGIDRNKVDRMWREYGIGSETKLSKNTNSV